MPGLTYLVNGFAVGSYKEIIKGPLARGVNAGIDKKRLVFTIRQWTI